MDSPDLRFPTFAAVHQLPASVVHGLRDDGYAVIPGHLPADRVTELSGAYDRTVRNAHPDDISIGSTTTRVGGFIDRDPIFDGIYLYPPLLEAARCVIGQPFKLSVLHARTLHPQTPAQKLHVDFPADQQGWPMLGFILMIDEFSPDNGATCFLPGSQGSIALPALVPPMPACGPAGSLIIYNGSVWHGHGANQTLEPRRSLQGAYIRRNQIPGGDPSPSPFTLKV